MNERIQNLNPEVKDRIIENQTLTISDYDSDLDKMIDVNEMCEKIENSPIKIKVLEIVLSQEINASDLEKLLDPKKLPELKDLKIPYCGLGFEEITALANLPILKQLQSLDLSGNPITSKEIKLLLESDSSKLKTLKLQNLPFKTPEADSTFFDELSQTLSTTNLEELNVELNKKTYLQNARKLLKNSKLKKLTIYSPDDVALEDSILIK